MNEALVSTCSKGRKEAERLMGPVLFGQAGVSLGSTDRFLCPLANISDCGGLTNLKSSLTLLVYNPLPRTTSHYVKVPLGADYMDARVYDEAGTLISR